MCIWLHMLNERMGPLVKRFCGDLGLKGGMPVHSMGLRAGQQTGQSPAVCKGDSCPSGSCSVPLTQCRAHSCSCRQASGLGSPGSSQPRPGTQQYRGLCHPKQMVSNCQKAIKFFFFFMELAFLSKFMRLWQQ